MILSRHDSVGFPFGWGFAALRILRAPRFMAFPKIRRRLRTIPTIGLQVSQLRAWRSCSSASWFWPPFTLTHPGPCVFLRQSRRLAPGNSSLTTDGHGWSRIRSAAEPQPEAGGINRGILGIHGIHGKQTPPGSPSAYSARSAVYGYLLATLWVNRSRMSKLQPPANPRSGTSAPVRVV